MEKISLLEGERIDDLQCGGARIIQHPGLFRFGTDAVLLQNFANLPSRARAVDLGTGTGCIGITLALELPHSRGLLLEYSAWALPVAARNISSLQAADRLALVRGDMFTPPLLPQGLDVLVSNPPYIAAAEEDEVMAEVLHHEPHSALFSEQDGLRHLHAVIRSGQQALKPGGLIAMEHGYRQGEAVRRLLMEAGYGAPRTEQDLAGLDRCTWARRD